MLWFANLKVMTKLMLAFCGVALLTLIVGLVGYRSLSIEDERYSRTYNQHFLGTATFGDMNTGLNTMMAVTAQGALTEDPEMRRSLHARYNEHVGEVGNDLQSADKYLTTEAGKAKLAEARKLYDPWKQNNDEIWRLVESGQTAKARELVAANRAAGESVDDCFGSITDMKIELMKKEYEAQDANFASTRTMIFGLIAFAMVASLLLGFFVARLIVTPLAKGVKLMESVAEGDFTQTLDVDMRDEIGQLASAMNRTVRTVREALSSVSESASAVTIASGELSSASQSISSGAQEQASSLEETAASLEEMTSAVKQNADNAQQAAQLAQGAREVAEKGGRVVGTAVSAMEEINAASRKIADIITAIDEIAFQTNLLALNAAVEAARAGEQGRGFAVVAGEVRNLAQRSASAAKEIKGLINDSVEKVESGAKLVNQSGTTLEEIVTSVKRVTDIVGEIAASSREQSTGIEQVNTAVTQMDAVTQANASQTEELAGTADGLSHQAQAMMTLVQKFKLGQDAQATAHLSVPTARPKAKVLPMRKPGGHASRGAATPPPAAHAATGTDGGFEEF